MWSQKSAQVRVETRRVRVHRLDPSPDMADQLRIGGSKRSEQLYLKADDAVVGPDLLDHRAGRLDGLEETDAQLFQPVGERG